jgi:GNAT superfamily N-acetyltransferase
VPDTPAILDAHDRNAAVRLSWLAARTSGMRVEDGAALCVVETGLPSPRLNVATRARIGIGVVDTVIARTMERFRASALPCSWRLTPASRPDDLGLRLVERGLRMARSFVIMSAELAEVADAFADAPPAGIRVALARRPAAITDVGRVLAALGGEDAPALAAYYAFAAEAATAYDAPCRHVLAYEGEIAVGCAELTLAEGVAGIHNVATLPSHRGRGIASAVTAAAVMEAQMLGFRTAVVEGTADGERLWARHGFATVGLLHEYR